VVNSYCFLERGNILWNNIISWLKVCYWGFEVRFKPLFSFPEQEFFHVKKEDIEAVVEKAFTFFWKKANYIPIVQSPDGR
jgi:hypothetical protein